MRGTTRTGQINNGSFMENAIKNIVIRIPIRIPKHLEQRGSV